MIQVAYAKCSLEITEKCCQVVIRSKQVYTSDFTRATTSGFSSRVVTWMQPCALEAVKRKNKKIQSLSAFSLAQIDVHIMLNHRQRHCLTI